MLISIFLIIFAFIRIHLVGYYRLSVLSKEGLAEYYRLPSFETMLWKCWIWRFSSFKSVAPGVIKYEDAR